MSASGRKRTLAERQTDVRFTPKHRCEHVRVSMQKKSPPLANPATGLDHALYQYIRGWSGRALAQLVRRRASYRRQICRSDDLKLSRKTVSGPR
jgi:hypothetical protein